MLSGVAWARIARHAALHASRQDELWPTLSGPLPPSRPGSHPHRPDPALKQARQATRTSDHAEDVIWQSGKNEKAALITSRSQEWQRWSGSASAQVAARTLVRHSHALLRHAQIITEKVDIAVEFRTARAGTVSTAGSSQGKQQQGAGPAGGDAGRWEGIRRLRGALQGLV